MKKAIAIFFMLILLLANMGITLSTHYCGGFMVKQAFVIGHKSLGCGMEDVTDDCNNNRDGHMHFRDHCCDDDFHTFRINEKFTRDNNPEDQDNPLIFFLPATFIFEINPVTTDNQSFVAHSPPDTKTDIPVLHRNLRI